MQPEVPAADDKERPDERKERESPHQKRKSRSRSPKKSRSKTRSRSQSPAKVHEPVVVERSFTKSESGDEAAQIDAMFSGFSAVPVPGDVMFHAAEPKSEEPVTFDSPPESPVTSAIPSTSNYRFASVIQKDTAPDPEPEPEAMQYASVIKSTEPIDVEHQDSNVYASVIKQSQRDERSHPLRQSMAERMEEIVQNRHDGRPTEFDDMQDDNMEYPAKTFSLSNTQRSEIANAMNLSRSQKADLSSSRRYGDEQEEYRPATPPDDYPLASATVSPRESFIRDQPPVSTRVPEMDLDSPDRPPTPPFDYTDRSERNSRTEQPNVARPNDFQGAFTNQVLQELKLRQKGASPEEEEDDDRAGRSVGFSRAPPQIIPRSEPNSPRESMNIPQTGAPQPVVVTPGVIPPAPPPPPPPPVK